MCAAPDPLTAAAVYHQQRAQQWNAAYARAAMVPGCIEVVVIPALDNLPVPVRWGKPHLPRVARRQA